jgi:hypothetical protein
MSKISPLEKKQRLTEFIVDMNNNIRSGERYSFTQAISKFRISWSANALSTRSILIQNGFIKQHEIHRNVYKYGERGKLAAGELAELVLDQIEGQQNYLGVYTSDVIAEKLDEPPTNDPSEPEQEIDEARESQKTTKFATESVPAKVRARVLEIQPMAEVEQVQETTELDEVEWSVIRVALAAMIHNGEDALYSLLAERIIKKIT